MPACRCIVESSSAMLSTKSSAGVAPEVNLRECVVCMPLPNVNRAVYREEIIKSSKQAAIKRHMSSNFFLKN